MIFENYSEMILKIQCWETSTVCLLVLSAEYRYKQFGPRSGPTKCRAWFGSKVFDTQMVILKEILERVDFIKNQHMTKKCKITQYAAS